MGDISRKVTIGYNETTWLIRLWDLVGVDQKIRNCDIKSCSSLTKIQT